MQDDTNIQLTNADDMLQFAKKNQTRIFKQHKQAFEEIASNLKNDEYAVFTMLADEYSINDTPGPWHAVLVVTNQRLLVCGETISGRMFTRYDTDCWMLDEIKSIHLEHQNIVIKTSEDKLKLKGENFDRLVSKPQLCYLNIFIQIPNIVTYGITLNVTLSSHQTLLS